MMNGLLILTGLLLIHPVTAYSQEAEKQMSHAHHHMMADDSGMVMNENLSTLPRDCHAISRDYHFTIHAGRKYASGRPGQIFGMSQPEIRVDPCSRVQVTFINEDSVRHQWMVHGLPKYLYPAGMFHIEVPGGKQKSGTLIVPGGDHTYLVHCDLAQHMEKGMRGQLVVGKGSGNLWGIPAVSDSFFRSSYLPKHILLYAGLAMIAGFMLTLLALKTVFKAKRPS